METKSDFELELYKFAEERRHVFIEIVLAYPDRMHWPIISKNPNLTRKFIKHFANFLDFGYISVHNVVTPDFIEQNPQINWNWRQMAHNKNITTKFIMKHANKAWEWNTVCKLYKLPFEFVLANTHLFIKFTDILLSYKKFTFDVVLNNLSLNWNWYILTKIAYPEFIRSNIKYNWDWRVIASRHIFTMEELINMKCKIDILLMHSIDVPEHILKWSHTWSSLVEVSGYPNIPQQLLFRQVRHWNFNMLSDCKTLTPEFLEQNLDARWHWGKLTANEQFPVEYILRTLADGSIPYWNRGYILTSRKDFKKEFFEQYKSEIMWDWYDIYKEDDCADNNYIDNGYIDKLINLYGANINVNKIIRRNDFTFSYVDKYPNFNWPFHEFHIHMKKIAARCDINEFIWRHRNQNWCWFELSKYVSFDLYIKLGGYPWDMEEITKKLPSFHFAMNNLLMASWNFDVLSRRPDIDLKMVNAFPLLRWDMAYISSSANTTLEDIAEYKNIRWHWPCFSMNPNLTSEFVRMYADKLDFRLISENKFFFDRDACEAAMARKKMAEQRRCEMTKTLEKHPNFPHAVMNIIGTYMH